MSRWCRCPSCGEEFTRIAGFVRHRVGRWSARRCLTPVEMELLGMTRNSGGRWHGASDESGAPPWHVAPRSIEPKQREIDATAFAETRSQV